MGFIEKFFATFTDDSDQKVENEYFANLELSPGADFEMIELAYKHLKAQYDPKKYGNNPEKQQSAEAIVNKLNEAYYYFQKKYETDLS